MKKLTKRWEYNSLNQQNVSGEAIQPADFVARRAQHSWYNPRLMNKSSN
jgi:hypothetical protein